MTEIWKLHHSSAGPIVLAVSGNISSRKSMLKLVIILTLDVSMFLLEAHHQRYLNVIGSITR